MNGEAFGSATAQGRGAASVLSSWKIALVATGVVFGGMVLLLAGTFWSMVSIWTRSDTFAHGYFILPISLYVAWTERSRLLTVSPRAEAWPLLLMVPLGIGWLGARLGGVLVMEQYFAVSLLVVSLWAVLGSAAARRLAFPLLFLLFAVPVGEGLLPYLIDGTTVATVAGLRLFGVPVFNEGNQLILPNGVWSVVEACSGLRYLIACVTVGLPFAYLTYTSWRRRLLFVAASIVVPIVANWLRAFMIVMIGYTSDMRLAVSVDHILYGWVLYAIVMFLLLWVGSKFAEPRESVEESVEPAETPTSLRRTVLVSVSALLLAGVWPAWAAFAHEGHDVVVRDFRLPDRVDAWTARGSLLAFEPTYVGADVVEGRVFEGPSGWVGLHVALYGNQVQGAELVSSRNVLLPPGGELWRELSRGAYDAELASVEEHVATSKGQRILIWHWYWVAGETTSSPMWAKAIEARRKLLGRPTPAAGIVVYTPTGPDVTEARERLSELVEAVAPELDRRLREALE